MNPTDIPRQSRPDHSALDAWESAYARFETPEEEVRKFRRRLRRLGADDWPLNSESVELFCGRGNGLRALMELGFTNVEGVDLSPALLALYQGSAKCYVCDCRELVFDDHSKDILIVQGGLHHLAELPRDLERTFSEMRRVLREEGRVIVVEPWRTPFLSLVHAISRNALARRFSKKLDAFETMFVHEKRTYEQWLDSPDLILRTCSTHFHPVHQSFSWGKWWFVGKPR